MKTVFVAGFFAIVGAIIGAGVSYKIASDNSALEKERIAVGAYTDLLNVYSHRTKILRMTDMDYWDSRKLFDHIKLVAPKDVTEASQKFLEASNNARVLQKTGSTAGWQQDKKSPYYLWDVRRKELVDAMEKSLPTVKLSEEI